MQAQPFSRAEAKHVTALTKQLLCRFCLAYENSLDEDYVTEKLFDCLRAGAIPVFASLSIRGVIQRLSYR